MAAPFIGPIDIEKYLSEGQIEQVICGGENYGGARPCDFDWVRSLRSECVDAHVTFAFIETGSVLVKDGRTYRLRGKKLQSQQAWKSGMGYQGSGITWHLTDRLGLEIPEQDLYQPIYHEQCAQCGSRPICNGCGSCSSCWMR